MKIIIALLTVCVSLHVNGQQKHARPVIGVVQDMERDSVLREAGFGYLVESVAKLISPRNVSEQQFQINVRKIRALKIPLVACNIFIPGELKVVGPAVDEDSVLNYVRVVFQRCQRAGIGMIIWGSGGSRRVPDGFDHAVAKKQFISIARKIAVLAGQHDITLALESLNSSEANFITTVGEALDVVKTVDHPNLRLCVDIYHMLKEGESPDIISRTGPYLRYCEIAERERRTPPGVDGDDFRPYLAALKNLGYVGKLTIECRWDDVPAQGAMVYRALQAQVQAVYGPD
ncbi:MAG TPA: sugar phosphate isomerase/epimerase family protein [Ohtaekwangia sp.]|nr:sugar phosphate isomerase/epimerase family protein [Ohtaekwangia sp.]